MASSTVARRRNVHVTSLEGEHAPAFGQPPASPSGRTPRSTIGSPLLTAANVRGSPLSTVASMRSGAGDQAAGPHRKNSLSEVQVLPWLCCMLPALSLYGHLFVLLGTYFVSDYWFHWDAVVLNWITFSFHIGLCVCSVVGGLKLRKGVETDWDALLESLQAEDPAANEVCHIVLLPNFKESEAMMLETLTNLGRSPLARGRLRIVLAMEAREGTPARDKAESLIHKTQHLFADIFATYHPADVPGEVAGKSSNTQWAYRAALARFGPILLGCDFSRIFITVGDADALWHPMYFSALTYQALQMSADERVWKMFQSPVLLARNLWSVPGPTRVTMYGTIIFELAGIGCQAFWPAFTYSAYSVTLALASHPEVDGWDVDVIAEDHHMFCKCYFAALWEQAYERKGDLDGPKMRPKVKVHPVFLPTMSYLVESNGYWASTQARFQQARRHAQGLVELGYVMLQYCRLWKSVGLNGIPVRTHCGILSIASKMHWVHVNSLAQAAVMAIVAWIIVLPKILAWVRSGAIVGSLMEGGGFAGLVTWALQYWQGTDLSMRSFLSSLSNFSLQPWMATVPIYLVIHDTVSGHYYKLCREMTLERAPRRMGRVQEEDDDDAPPAADPTEQVDSRRLTVKPNGAPMIVTGPMTASAKWYLAARIWFESIVYVFILLWFLILPPGMMAAWSLLRRGTVFEYIVAPKPE